MKNNVFMIEIIGFMLIFGTVTVSARDFSKNFNPDYRIYGFESLNTQKAVTARDLVLSDNFITNGNLRAMCEKVETKKDHFSMNLVLVSGLNRVARMKVTLKTSELTQQNYVTHFEFFDFATGQKEEIDYNGTQLSMDRLLDRYVQLMATFYNKDKLLSL